MNRKIKVLTIIGTRPEAIKMAPVIKVLNQSDRIANITCLSGQHPQLADEALGLFELKADLALPPLLSGGDLTIGMSVLLQKLGGIVKDVQPDWVFVHGDTATTAAAALAAFQNQTKIAHIEAGLRTGNLSSPWPEEGYRKIVGPLADLHFTPTEQARRNLVSEGVLPERVFLTGNTVVDALLDMRRILSSNPSGLLELRTWFSKLTQGRKPVLVTAHRRENHDRGIDQIAAAVQVLADRFRDRCFILPVHPNPTVSGKIRGQLQHIENVCLTDPLDYRHFVFAMERSELILTDSGGIQEEAPSFGTPVLIMRDHTERTEAIQAGVARLVGSETTAIVKNASEIIELDHLKKAMSAATNPFGDGKAAQRILHALLRPGFEEEPDVEMASLA